VALGIFFAYAYMKTQNLWVPIIMHFLFNGFAGVLIGGDMSVMQDQVSTWNDIPIELVSMLVFAIFIFAPIFRKKKEAEPIE
jgi:membrane protease YdiL (CAAX protease family)